MLDERERCEDMVEKREEERRERRLSVSWL
jgi:hypothetical protein